MNSSLLFFSREFINSLISFRAGEEKLGQSLHIAEKEDLNQFQGKFVILGIPEDIGIRANHGIGGAESGFFSFLKSFVNIQNSSNFNGNQFILLGQINTETLMEKSRDADTETLRKLTEQVDELVFPIIQTIVTAGKIPIVIGGGHNNSFPIIKGCSLGFQKPINTINLDAHADFRALEGRHSGNGFRYAYEADFLKKYAMLGLHEAYNSEQILDELKGNPNLLSILFEDIFLRKKESWKNAQQRALAFVRDDYFGVELDIDSIENILSSAWSPIGISANKSLNFLYNCGKEKNVSYLHLPEAIAKREDGMEHPLIGKLLNYMVQAFCKGVQEQIIRPSIH